MGREPLKHFSGLVPNLVAKVDGCANAQESSHLSIQGNTVNAGHPMKSRREANRSLDDSPSVCVAHQPTQRRSLLPNKLHQHVNVSSQACTLACPDRGQGASCTCSAQRKCWANQRKRL